MPRFHFHLVQQKIVEDVGGHIYPDDLSAFAAADRQAKEIYLVRPSLEGQGYALVVTDGTGKELYRAPIDRGPRLAPD